MAHRSLRLTINMLDTVCYRARVGSFYSRCVTIIYQKFRRKNNVSLKSKSYRQKSLPKTPASFFGFVSLLIATYFLLKLIIESIESNPGLSNCGAYVIEKGSPRHISSRKYSIWGNCRYTMYCQSIFCYNLFCNKKRFTLESN